MLRRTLLQVPFAMAAKGNELLPAFYNRVARVTWVVENAAATAARWGTLGIPAGGPLRLDAPAALVRGRKSPATFSVVSGSLGTAVIDWIEPEGRDNPFAAFLAENRGPGVLGLMYETPTLEAYHAEVARMKRAGLAPLMEASAAVEDTHVSWTFFDTWRSGKYALGLIHGAASNLPEPPRERRATQYAFVTRNPEAVSSYWEKVGFPAFTYSRVNGRDSVYRGKPGVFDMRLGWQRHTTVPFEWIEPLKGPSCYHEQLDAHGEGFHHLAFGVAGMDAAIAAWRKAGFEIAMSGAWGDKDQPGSGRYAYVDTREIGGIYIELLWNYRAAQ